MGAQGDQVAPRVPKLKANDAQSLPKVIQRHPKTPKVFQDEPKIGPEVLQNCQKSSKKHNPDLERFWKRYLEWKSQILSGFWKLVPSKNIVKTMVLEAFSIFAVLGPEVDFRKIFERFRAPK